MILTDKQEIRFWSKVNKIGSLYIDPNTVDSIDKTQCLSNCWEWLNSIDRYGYGKVKLNGKMVGVHRISYELYNGSIPAKMCVCHRCDNRKCINPEHLWLGTHLDNAQDRDSKGRGAINSGERSGMSKLTDAQVIEIRDKYKLGNTSMRKLGKEYNVSSSRISDIITYKTWKHIS